MQVRREERVKNEDSRESIGRWKTWRLSICLHALNEISANFKVEIVTCV